MAKYERGRVKKNLIIRSPDTIEKVNRLAVLHKLKDETKPNPTRIARKLLREASNAWLNFPELYEQLMSNIAQIEKSSKKKTA